MEIKYNVPLKPFHTFGINVFAKEFASFGNTDTLKEILEYNKSGKMMILGGGSNVLFTKNYNGLILKNEIPGIEIISADGETVLVKAGAGVNWHSFVMFCLNNNLAGVENLALIPGNVGASPMQNIGAYGVEIKDVFHSLTALDIADKTTTIFNNNECKFGYRESVFKHELKNRFVITDVIFRLQTKPVFHTSYGAIDAELKKMKLQELSIQAIAQAVINIRSSKLPDPKLIGNSGSFFKNPEIEPDQYEQLQKNFPAIVAYKTGRGFKLAAAWLIEQCGWKGFREGDAGCHIQQPLVLVNYGNATGEQILSLSERIIDSVHTKFNIILEREVNVL